MEYIKKNINFFEMKFKFDDDTTTKEILRLTFQKFGEINRNKLPYRYFRSTDGLICTNDIFFDGVRKTIKGKFIRLRMDNFPELMKLSSDEIRDIEADEDEGVCETTHFHIDFNDFKIKIALEFNMHGPKLGDIVKYISYVWLQSGRNCECELVPIIKDELPSFLNRMNRCSAFTAKVHKDYIHQIKNVDDDLFTAFDSVNKFASNESDYVEILIKFDFKKKTGTSITQKGFELIKKILGNRIYANYFDELTFLSEDNQKNNKLELFNLIGGNIHSTVNVQKKPKVKHVVSADMYEKLERELNSKAR